MYQHLLIIVATLVVMLTSGGVFGQEAKQHNMEKRGAICLTRVNNQLLMIREDITGKLSVPGGNINLGETPEQAAQREAWEETGLVVEVNKELGRTQTAYVFDCVSQSDVIAFKPDNAFGGNTLPVWVAPDFGIETINGMLIEPSRVAATDYRFPAQWHTLKAMFKQATDQPVRKVDDLIAVAPFFQQYELHFLVKFQNALLKMPEWASKTVLGIVAIGNVFANPMMAWIVFPFLMYFVGTRITLKLFVSMAFVSLMCHLLQRGLALPRPYVYLPTIQPLSESGYSMPCVVTAILTCSAFVLWQERENITWPYWTPTLTVIIVWQTLGQFLAGDMFITDCIVGAVLGAIVSWNVYQLESRTSVDFTGLLCSYKIWLGLLLLTGMLTYLWATPGFRHWLSILTAVILALAFVRQFETKPTLLRVIVCVGVLVCQDRVFKLALEHFSYSTDWCLSLSFMHYGVMIFTLFALMFNGLSLHRVHSQLMSLIHYKNLSS